MTMDEAATFPLPPDYPLGLRWSFKNHFLSGITLPAWLRMLWRHWDIIVWHLYWQRVAFLGIMACLNSLLGCVDSLVYGRAIQTQPLHPHPLIILGHPRTGTTPIHNLLAQDPQFACARTLHAGFPASFMVLERFRWLLAPIMDDTRPMDAMPLSFDTPAEDEIAVSALTAVSAYMPLVFMRDRSRFDALYTFSAANPADFKLWQGNLLWFFRKVTLRWGGCKPLLIKSPVHTARANLFLAMFPQAKFVYVHRDPLTTFASAGHMAATYYPYCSLQQPTEQDVTDFILDQFDLLFQQYQEDRKHIPPGSLVEVSFAELDRDPVAVMRRIYQQLGLGGFEAAQPAMEQYCAGLALKGFKKNVHRPLSQAVKQRVRQRWAPFYHAFGYPLDDHDQQQAAP